jgi:hypothetical protein
MNEPAFLRGTLRFLALLLGNTAGTERLKDVEVLLPRIAELSFEVLYLLLIKGGHVNVLL